MAMLALMLARYPSMDRFIRWHRQQIARIESGELIIPVRLVDEDNQLDLPREPGPDAVSVEELRWRTNSVRLELTIWRPHELSQRRYAKWRQQTAPGTREHNLTLSAWSSWKDRSTIGIHADPHAYFVEVHPTEATPWFMGPVADWYARLGRGHRNAVPSNARSGRSHAGVGTPTEWLVKYLRHLVLADRQHDRHMSQVGVCFDPEATRRGVLFGTAIVTLMLTADARIHEILQISVDRFVRPVRLYIVKNLDGTPKRDPTTHNIPSRLATAATLGYASAVPRGRSASAAHSSCADPSTSIASSLCSTAT